MDQISSYLLLGFEGTKDLLITLGFDGIATPTTAPQGGGTSRKLKKRKPTRTIKFSDFASREDYERELRNAAILASVVAPTIEIAEPSPENASSSAEFRNIAIESSAQLVDSAIMVSSEELARIESARGDEEALLLILAQL